MATAHALVNCYKPLQKAGDYYVGIGTWKLCLVTLLVQHAYME